jgi:hypothetical protein
MASKEYKYRINEIIEQLPRSMTIGKIESILKAEHQISRDSFFRDRTLKISDRSSIPSERLDVYAALFNCSADDLKNYQPKAVKPLTERAPSQAMQKIIKKNGLKKS